MKPQLRALLACTALALAMGLTACGGSSAPSSSASSTPSTTSAAPASTAAPSSAAPPSFEPTSAAVSIPSPASIQPQVHGDINVRDEFLGDWTVAVIAYENEANRPELEVEDWKVNISKDGVVRYSTGDAITLEVPKNADGNPDPETYDYYFVTKDFVPADHSSILFDMFGSENDELWESHVLEGGISYNFIYTRDGNPPGYMMDSLEEQAKSTSSS